VKSCRTTMAFELSGTQTRIIYSFYLPCRKPKTYALETNKKAREYSTLRLHYRVIRIGLRKGIGKNDCTKSGGQNSKKPTKTLRRSFPHLTVCPQSFLKGNVMLHILYLRWSSVLRRPVD
jgi:hypothetical protein